MSRGGTQTSKFGLRDLGMFIPDEVDLAAGGRDATADPLPAETLKPKFNPMAKVTRYFPGKAPKWLQQKQPGDSSDDDATAAADEEREAARRRLAVRAAAAAAAAATVEEAGGRRRRRRAFQATEVEDEEVDEMPFGDEEENDDEEEGAAARARARARARSRSRAAAAASSSVGEDDDPLEGDVAPLSAADPVNAETEDEILARRARIRSRLGRGNGATAGGSGGGGRQRAAAVEVASDSEGEEMPIQDSEDEDGDGGDGDDSEEEDDGSSSGSWETDSDADIPGPGGVLLKKPTFVPKSQRVTIQQRQALQAQEEAKFKAQEIKLGKRAQETRQLVVDEIQAEQDEQDGDVEEDAEMPDDADDPDDLEEYRAWKLRELKRLKRDRDVRRKVEMERAEIERRRGLTDAQRQKEDQELIAAGLKKDPNAKKSKLKFGQKYYHKGVFYMDDDSVKDKDDVRRKDYNEPTLEDHYDKKAMPKVMQVKNFGKIGQTKYTHLADQDTTDRDNPFFRKSKALDSMMKRRAGLHGDLESAGRLKRSRRAGGGSGAER